MIAWLKKIYWGRKIKQGLRVLEGLDGHLRKAGYKRVERRQFWKEFTNKARGRELIYTKLKGD